MKASRNTALLLLTFQCAIFASPRWQPFAPPSGIIQQLAVDRRHPHVLFAINSNILYRSSDSGQNWKKVNVPGIAEAGSSLYPANAISVHPLSSEVLIASINEKHQTMIWGSSDLGVTFQVRAISNQARYILPVVFKGSPFHAGTWYGESVDGLSVSRDDGVHWQQMPFPKYPMLSDRCGKTKYYIRDFAISPVHDGDLFVSAAVECEFDYSVFEEILITSRNGGISWRVSKNTQSIQRFHYDPVFSGRLYGTKLYDASPVNGLFLLEDRTWRKLSNKSIREVVADPRAPLHLFAIERPRGHTRLIETWDGGKTWNQSRLEPVYGFNQMLVLNDGSLDLLGASNGPGIYRHKPGTAPSDWSHSNQGMIGGQIFGLAHSGSTMYASVSGNCCMEGALLFLRSKDNGRNWEDLTTHLPRIHSGSLLFIRHLYANPKDSNNILMVMDDQSGEYHTFLSLNGGVDWENLFVAATSVAFDSSSYSVVYLANTDALYRSTERGRTPVQMPTSGLQFDSVYVDEVDPRSIYLFGEQLYKSTNGGSHFESAMNGIKRKNVYTDNITAVHAPDTYLISTSDGIYRTVNAAGEWQKVGSFRNPYGQTATGKILSADDVGAHLYLFDLPSFVFESKDSGKNWRDITALINPLFTISPLSVIMTKSHIIYTGTDGGIFKLPR